MLNFGRIFLDRKIKEWRWYKDGNTSRLFIHLLLSVNYEDRHFENITVHRGEIVTSSSKLAEELRLSRQNIRTALNHLKSTGEITTKQHSKFTVITINNYNVYQDLTTLLTSNQPQCNKVKESKNTYLLVGINPKIFQQLGQFQHLKKSQLTYRILAVVWTLRSFTAPTLLRDGKQQKASPLQIGNVQ